MSKKIKIVTHNGDFHPDDVFAVAVLSICLENSKEEFEVIRSRDPEIISQADFVVDVGGLYDEQKNLFDHHQEGGAGLRENKIPFASFGLVWKKFGTGLCFGSKEIWQEIDQKLVQPIDAGDVGLDIVEIKFDKLSPYTISNFIKSFVPTWKQEDVSVDEVFKKVVLIAKEILQREIISAKDELDALDEVLSQYEKSEDKRLLVLSKNLPWHKVAEEKKDILFVVYPSKVSNWNVQAVKKDPNFFDNRKDLPSHWAGKRDGDLAEITGVPDAVFCHIKLFLAVAKSKEGALALAKIALSS